MSRPTLWSTGDMDEALTDAVDVELSMYAQQGHQQAVYDHLGAQIDQLDPAVFQQHLALAAVPDVVKSFIVSFQESILTRNLPSITLFYTTTFPKLTERFYARTEWPEPETIAPLLSPAPEDEIHIFLVLYRDLYYRHVYSRLQPNIDDRFHSYENSCELFNYLLNSPSGSGAGGGEDGEDGAEADEPQPVDLVLPDQWLWDIIDEFIYQFQVFCSWRQKIKSKTDDELMMLAEGTGVWSSYSVLNVLYSLIQKSKINEYILALKSAKAGETPEEIAKGISKYTTLPLYRTLGYFSILGLLRVHVLLGDFTLALKVMDQAGDFLLGSQVTTSNNSKNASAPSPSLLNSALPSLPATHVSTSYYVGFSYLMLGRYPDALRTFVAILNFSQRIARMRSYSNGIEDARKDAYDQILKTSDRTLALYAIAHALVLPGSPFSRLDDNITNSAKERFGEAMTRMSKGSVGGADGATGGNERLAAFEELFLYACPKFINANSPPYDDPDAIAALLRSSDPAAAEADDPTSASGSGPASTAGHTDPTHRHLHLFLATAAAQAGLPTLRSFLHLYTSLTTEKLGGFLAMGRGNGDANGGIEDEKEREEEAIQEMMVLKQSSRSLSRVVGTQTKDAKGSLSLLDGEMISTSDLNFVIDDSTIHIAESTIGRRYAGWFIKNTERSQRILDEIRAAPLPKPKIPAVPGSAGLSSSAPYGAGSAAGNVTGAPTAGHAAAAPAEGQKKKVAWGGARA